MADSLPANSLQGRTLILAGGSGALRNQAGACLAALGAELVNLESDGKSGPGIADLKEENRVAAALDRIAEALDPVDAIIFVGRDLTDGEDMAEFIEESIASYHFYLKLAKRLGAKAAMDVVALAGAGANGEAAGLAADVRNGALRQMSLVAASEGGPMRPPLLVNAVFVSGEPQAEASHDNAGSVVREQRGMKYVSGTPTVEPSPSLTALMARLLARPQGYITGTTLNVSL